MDTIFEEFGEALTNRDGYRLARTLNPELSYDMLRLIYRSANHASIRDILRHEVRSSISHLSPDPDEVHMWVEVYTSYWKTCGEVVAVQEQKSGNTTSSWTKVYEAWKDLFAALHRGYMNAGLPAWTIPCLYVIGKYLRVFAVKADEERNSSDHQETTATNFQDDLDMESEKNQQLRDCGVQLNRMFTLCLNDREPLLQSRKWGIYNVGNLLFKTYFKLKNPDLCKNVLRALTAGRGDMPPFEEIPKSQQVIFKYHQGVLEFLDENYPQAEEHLTIAWNLCHKNAMRNKELILTYLIPCHLVNTATLPSKKLLEPYPRLQKLFLPLCGPIRKGELHAFDLALQDGEDEFVKRRIYLTLERGRDIALRNLLRKVFLAGGFEQPKEPGAKPLRRTRVPLDEFVAAISLGSQEKLDSDEAECLLANMIYKGLMKGYISRAHNIVVLSKSGAFPPTGV